LRARFAPRPFVGGTSSLAVVPSLAFVAFLALGPACAKVVEQAPAFDGGAGSGGGGAGGDDAGEEDLPPVFNFDTHEGPPPSQCGNGMKESGEGCDDGNTTAGDGCSNVCIVEAMWTCPTEGKPCVHDTVCGDHMIEGMEACDDGNTTAGDGCAADCTLECGWECPGGMNCRAAMCGDGKVAGKEQCDDGNTTDGDGCSAICTLESKPVGVAEGWVCTSPAGAGSCKGPTTCTNTTCGNKIKEGSEQCDDGNTVTGDGCSPFCRLEPQCPATGGPCTTACGDGLLLPIDKMNGQECDDGDTVSGDGCSADCKIEAGYKCTDISTKPDKLVLPIVYHDFKGWDEGDTAHDHPDFQHFQGNGRGFAGITQAALGPMGVPVHVAGCFPMAGGAYPSLLTANSCAQGGAPGPAWDMTTDWFGMWYVDNATYNKTIVSTLTLPPMGNGAFQFGSTCAG
jgi:cysteine-rich repeat protein